MKKYIPLFGLLVLASCKTYTLKPDDLVRQLRDAQPKDVTVSHSVTPFASTTYKGNGVSQLECYDKKGQKHVLPISPAVETRIRLKKGGKRLYYFDTIALEDSTISGCNSRILHTRRTIPISEIKTVEVQNGGKDYSYKKG